MLTQHYEATKRWMLRGQMLPLVAKDSARTWIHLALPGDYMGHPSGSFILNRKTFQSFVDNFNRQKNPLPLTYEHPQYAGDGRPIKAAGWIHELEIRPSGLWGFTEFTKPAEEMVRAGEYKFTSIVFSDDSVDRKTGGKTGPILFEVGLVNSPFIDGQEAVTLSWQQQPPRSLSMSYDLQALIKALKELPTDASKEQLHKALDAALLMQEAISGESDSLDAPTEELSPPALEELAAPAIEAPAELAAATEQLKCSDTPTLLDAAAQPTSEAEAGSSRIAQLLEDILGKDAAGCIAWLEENKEQLQALSGGPSDAPTREAGDTMEDYVKPGDTPLSNTSALKLSVMESTVASLSMQLESYKAKELAAVQALEDAKKAQHKLSIEGRVNTAVQEGKISDTSAPVWIAYGCTEPAEFDKMFSTIKSEVPTYQVVGAPKALSTSSVTQSASEEDEEVSKYVKALTPIHGAVEAKSIALKRVKERRKKDFSDRA